MKKLEEIRTLSDLDVTEKRVIIRLDLNVPIKDQEIQDDFRIRESLPSLRYLLQKEAKILILAHLGRPKGEVVKNLSLEAVGNRISQLLGVDVLLVEEPRGDATRALFASLKTKQLLLMENLRFDPGEKSNDTTLASHLSQSIDVYINDAFGVCHREHCSVSALPNLMPERGVGLLMEKEIKHLGRFLQKQESSRAVILGGAKVSDKIKLIENLMPHTQAFLIGGAMANTFLKAQGHSIGKSKFEEKALPLAKDLLRKFEARDIKCILPIDYAWYDEQKEGDMKFGYGEKLMSATCQIFDLGPKSIKLFQEELVKYEEVFWNGPLGFFERKPFEKGTLAVAKTLSEKTSEAEDSFTVIGGGDTALAIAEYAENMSHVSTGGGASLEFMQNPIMPGLKALLPTRKEIAARERVVWVGGEMPEGMDPMREFQPQDNYNQDRSSQDRRGNEQTSYVKPKAPPVVRKKLEGESIPGGYIRRAKKEDTDGSK